MFARGDRKLKVPGKNPGSAQSSSSMGQREQMLWRKERSLWYRVQFTSSCVNPGEFLKLFQLLIFTEESWSHSSPCAVLQNVPGMAMNGLPGSSGVAR